MSSTILLQIITPLNVELERAALMITIPGEDGMLGVMPNHALLIAALKPGLVEVFLDHNKSNNLIYFVYGGLAEITGTNINVVTDFAINCTNLDKSVILDKINLLKSKIAQETAPNHDNINDGITRYESLLNSLSSTYRQ